MAYGQILNDRQCAAGGAPWTDTPDHTLNNATFCAYAAQDITGGGVLRADERLWCPLGATRTATTVQFSDNTVAGRPPFSAYLTTAYSVLDVGPIVIGGNSNFRPTTAVSSYVLAGRPSYRSLHQAVPFLTTGAHTPANPLTVIVTHRLQTAAIAVYVFPCTDPWDADVYGQPGSTLRVWADTATTTTVALHVARTDGNAIQNVGVTYNWDVMVMARVPGVTEGAVPTRVVRGPFHSTTHPRTNLNTGDYTVGGDRVATHAIASYWAQYSGVNAIAAGPGGLQLTHNLGAVARLNLFGFTLFPNTRMPYTIARGLGGSPTTITHVGQVGGANLDACYVLTLRNYSLNVPTP